jgi:LuxR family transcriptional regulator, maltose regulon positive regulatory protein
MPAQNRLDRAAALEVLIRAHSAPQGDGDLDRARAALDELQTIARDAHTPPLRASASLGAGLIAFAAGDFDAARRDHEDAVDLFERSGAPLEVARARLALAAALEKLGRIDAAVAELDHALEAVTRLDARIEMSSAQFARHRLVSVESAKPAVAKETSGLTARELEVLRLISSGLSNQAIADRLCISEHTVHRHVSNTLSKLAVPSRSAAVAHAARLGLL